MTTPLDTAHAAMQAAPQDDTARLRFYERLADAELFLMLANAPDGDKVDPALFELPEGRFVLAFDLEDRLAEFADHPVPYLALSGRALTHMLKGQDIGLGLNLDVAPSAILLPGTALAWLGEMLTHAPTQSEARPERFAAPSGLPAALIEALDNKLAAAVGLARCAYLAKVVYEGGGLGHVLGFVGAVPQAEPALAAAINEALVFSGLEAGALDVVFLRETDSVSAELARVALRFDLPQPDIPERIEPVAPGSDPNKPPILR